jgi:hypothetical protein
MNQWVAARVENEMTGQDPEQNPNSSEQVRAQHVTARVPEGVSQGVFSTGVILMTGANEFVIDFVQNVGPPASVAARVVVPHGVLPQLIEALRKNLDAYGQRFGLPPDLPKPPPGAKRPTVQEIYDELKIADDVLPGAYANGLMIGHTASEFKLDFLTNLFPHSAVSSRVFVSAPQVPRMIESLNATYQQFVQRVKQQTEQQDPVDPPEPPAEDPGSQ